MDELIPHIYALKNSPELVTEDDDFVFVGETPPQSPRTTYNYSTFEEEVIQYLFGKVSSLAQLEEGEEYPNMETAIQDFHNIFHDLAQEKLLTCINK